MKVCEYANIVCEDEEFKIARLQVFKIANNKTNQLSNYSIFKFSIDDTCYIFKLMDGICLMASLFQTRLDFPFKGAQLDTPFPISPAIFQYPTLYFPQKMYAIQ